MKSSSRRKKNLGAYLHWAQVLGTDVVKGVFCNWMGRSGRLQAWSRGPSVGKIAEMWIPIMTFFRYRFEHYRCVNMFLILMA